LADLTEAEEFCMMLASDKLRVSLVTTHAALKDVPALLNKEKIVEKTMLTYRAMVELFGISSPRIGVASLNPHGGEKGIFGEEEETIIRPAVEEAKRSGANVEGPLPSDTLFCKAREGVYDAVVAMYHDQGLIPLKLLSFGESVNVTLGLPIIRTSVDHGTAYDIAGKGVADPTSLVNAIKMAVAMVKRKSKILWIK
ncbi:MAG: 4-hydroxythreonine-4-phosphate dehydrogenase PdxA, partial [Thermodesulfobacteriota bacterium]